MPQGTLETLSGNERNLVQQLLESVRLRTLPAPQAWQQLCQCVLRPDQPFELHQALYNAVYAYWDVEQLGPRPVWIPSEQQARACNAAHFMESFQGDLHWEHNRTGSPSADWPLLQRVSCQNPDAFWAAVLQGLRIRFSSPPTRILQEHPDPDKCVWLPGARLNAAHAALHCQRAVAGAPAIVWAEEGAPTQLQRMSLEELRQHCGHVAACIAARFQPGDALAINMPMTVEAVVIYLGVVLAGCVVVSIADSFAAEEVATRLRISKAKAIFTQDVVLRGGKALPLFSRVKEAGGVPAIVLPAGSSRFAKQQQQQRPASREPLRPMDMLWEDFLAAAPQRHAACEGHVVGAGAVMNILFSSGTTGEPKAIPWTHVTPLRAAVDAWAHQDVRPGDVVCWPTNLGWMMGPWLVFAALLNGATIALYQGSPLGRDFGEFVAAARVTMLGLVPSIAKAWRHSNCLTGLDWSGLRCFSSTGEASAPEDYHWLASRVQGYRPVIEYCGGTEIGGAFLSGTLLQPQAPSAFSTATLGAALVLMGPGGEQSPPVAEGAPFIGELTLAPPMLGSSQTLLNRDHHKTYYEGMPLAQAPCGSAAGRTAMQRPLRRHGDEVQRLPGGYYCALGRCDDTMNLGGIKVSSVEIERVIMEAVPAIAEVAAVGIPAQGGGPELLHLFVVPKGSTDGSPSSGNRGACEPAALQKACQAALRAHLNPLFKVEALLLRQTLPRTASNKVMRRVLRDQVVAAQAPRARM